MRAELLVWLANVDVPRRPSPSTPAPPPPDDVAVLPGRELARLCGIARRMVEDLLAGRNPDATTLTALNKAATSTARPRLAWRDGRPRAELAWHDPSPTAAVARRLIDEVAAVEPTRLRRCARPECDLVFYDDTRSATRRWHADNPCGWRERQARRRNHA